MKVTLTPVYGERPGRRDVEILISATLARADDHGNAWFKESRSYTPSRFWKRVESRQGLDIAYRSLGPAAIFEALHGQRLNVGGDMDDARRLWAAGIFPWGTEIFGGIWDTDRFYRTRAEAIRDIEAHAIGMGLLPISWSAPDEKLTIGRTHKPGNENLTYVVLVRSGRLPDGM